MIYLGSDHAGYALKERIKAYLSEHSIEYVDFGTDSADQPADFPHYGFAVAEAVVGDRDSGVDALGVLCCGSGIGMDIAANKVRGARAALALNAYMGAQSREHDDANIIVLPGRIIDADQAIDIFEHFLHARFDGNANHARRVQAIIDYEQKNKTL